MIDRVLNYFFGFIVIILFVLVADPEQRVWLIMALCTALLISIILYVRMLLTLDGAAAALVVGLITFGFGGAEATFFLLLFVGSVMGWSWWIDETRVIGSETYPSRFSERRTGNQVWANAFWFCVGIVGSYTFSDGAWFVAAVAAITAASSDTWASLTGMYYGSDTRLVTTFRKTRPGTDGGISLHGSLMAIIVSFVFAATFFLLLGFDLKATFLIFVCGITGCFLDSLFGAIFQVHAAGHDNADGFASKIPDYLMLTNNSVNALATGISAFIAFLIY